MVSKLEMLGLRDRAEVGVEGREELDENDTGYVLLTGYASLNRAGGRTGDDVTDVGVLGIRPRVGG